MEKEILKIYYKGIPLKVIEVDSNVGIYNERIEKVRKLVAPNGIIVPYPIKIDENLDNIMGGVLYLLENLEFMGDVKTALTKPLTTN